jgi:transcriptional regulator with XRE-family HTH domain
VFLNVSLKVHMVTIASLNLSSKQCYFGWRDDSAMHVGRRLKQLMQAKGISTEKMAALCGVTPGAVSNWFATGHITRENLVIAADALGESVRYLITGDERDRPASEIEAEFARRDVAPGTREAILTLLRASPVRQAAPAPAAPDADADHFHQAIGQPATPALPHKRRTLR